MPVASARDSDRKLLLADAAIEVVAVCGLRGLTHRAVETRAGLPAGTCSYHFSTRRALIAATLNRIAALDLADVDRVQDGRSLREMDLATVIEAGTAVLANWLGPARARSRALLLLRLDPQSRQLAAPTSESLADAFQVLATDMAGDADRGALLVAVIDELIVEELAIGATPVDVERLRARLTALTPLVLPDRT